MFKEVNDTYMSGTHGLFTDERGWLSDVIVFFWDGNSQLFEEEAGRGAAGPLISHSLLTATTDLFLAPEHLHVNHLTHSLLLLHTTDYEKTKLCEQFVSRVLRLNRQQHTAQRQQEAAWNLQRLWYSPPSQTVFKLWVGFGLLLLLKCCLFTWTDECLMLCSTWNSVFIVWHYLTSNKNNAFFKCHFKVLNVRFDFGSINPQIYLFFGIIINKLSLSRKLQFRYLLYSKLIVKNPKTLRLLWELTKKSRKFWHLQSWNQQIFDIFARNKTEIIIWVSK